MLCQKWVLISRSAELNEIARHASPHTKKTLEHTICLSKRIDADQRCGASDLHLELKFAGVMKRSPRIGDLWLPALCRKVLRHAHAPRRDCRGSGSSLRP